MTVTSSDSVTLITEVKENLSWSEEENQKDVAGPSTDSDSPEISPARNVFDVWFNYSFLVLQLFCLSWFYNIIIIRSARSGCITW